MTSSAKKRIRLTLSNPGSNELRLELATLHFFFAAGQKRSR